MRKIYMLILLAFCFFFNKIIFSDSVCSKKIAGFSIVKNTTYPFYANNQEACFFAYYTKNPDPTLFPKGNGNLGDSVWYAYYIKSDPEKIIKLPMPNDDNWGLICNVHAISFIDINGDGLRDITIIGACDKQNFMNLTFPIVFINTGKHYKFNKDVYDNLFGFIGLSIFDIRAYFKDPAKYYSVLQERNEIH